MKVMGINFLMDKHSVIQMLILRKLPKLTETDFFINFIVNQFL